MPQRTCDVTFSSPAIGDRYVPIGYEGPGTITWDEREVRLRGRMRSEAAHTIFGFFFAVGGFALGIVIAVWLRLDVKYMGGIVLGFLVGSVKLGGSIGSSLFPPKELELVMPWKSISKLELDGGQVRFLAHEPKKRMVAFGFEFPGAIDIFDSAAVKARGVQVDERFAELKASAPADVS